MARTDPIYADASALVKLLVAEPESAALQRELRDGGRLVTSKLALVEVPRATSIADPSPEMVRDTQRLLASCLLVDVTDEVLDRARLLTSRRVRALDAIHIATALRVGAQRILAYDRRLLAAATAQGLAVSHPGLEL